MSAKKSILCFLSLLLLIQFLPSQNVKLLAQEVEDQKALQEYLQTINDGPYMFRQDGKLLVKYIYKGKLYEKPYKAWGEKLTVKIKPFKQKYSISLAKPRVDYADFKKVKKLFIISDIHGQYKIFRTLLVKHKVVTKKMRWRWGKGHLVVLGDIFDRGPEVTELMWTVYSLEQQAMRRGGRVHFLLGNHEVMPFYGDYRYVHKKYIQACLHILKIPYPQLYGPDTILGQWLRSKNTIIRINDILLVHAGVHPAIMEQKLKKRTINFLIRSNIGVAVEALKSVDILNFLFFDNGPLWFRGYFKDVEGQPKITPEVIQQTLDYFNAKTIVVGHTTLDQVTPLFKNRVIAIDSGIKSGEKGEALLWKKGRFYRAQLSGKQEPIKQAQ
jgi:hypothetical protein